MQPPLRRVVLWVVTLLLGLPLVVPDLVWGDGRVRYPFEYGLALAALGFAAHTRFRAAARRAVVALYAVLLLFLFYQRAFESFFRRDAALVEDWRLAINLFHFLTEMTTWRWLLMVFGSILGAIALVVALGRVLAAVQLELEAQSVRRLGLATAAWAVVGGVSAFLGGPIRAAGAPIVQNYRASVAVRQRLLALGDTARDDRYQDLMRVKLAKRPTFYFLVIEAYGEVLATWDMTDAYRALMARLQGRLEAAGYRARTAYSVAPVHGGRSWLSLATMQSGVLVDQPETFTAFQTSSQKIPTLVGFFRAQGYHTASLEPGTKSRPGLASDDLYAHDLRVTAPDLGYEGKRWGFGEIPDRYTLETFRARWLGTIPEPRYLFFMAVSTHYPWNAETVPTYEGGGDWPPIPGTEKIGSEFRRYYFKSVEYTWRVIADFLESESARDVVVVVLGDHQPRLESNAPGEVTFDTPVHVLSRDGAFVDRFAGAGFQPGLFAEPGRARPLQHEGLFSLFVTELAEAYGTLDTQGLARWFPEGISLRGLNPP